MPTYEYICSKCDQSFEMVQSIKDEPLSTCPKDKCRRKSWGKGKVKRAIGAGAGLIFKGTGFYITDYRSENYKQGAKNESGASSSGSTASGEAKPSPGKTETSAAPSTPAPAKEAKKPKPASST
jgi:putative FmdB family regulatory protein